MRADTAEGKKIIRVLIADDHAFLRAGIEAIVSNERDMEFAGEAANGTEVVERYRALVPDVTLMDLQMPGMHGIEAIEAIRGEFPTAKIIVLTTYSGDAQAKAAMEAGARGYLLKSGLRSDMVEAIRRVHGGGTYIHESVSAGIAEHRGSETLSDRELKALRLIAVGRTNQQIGEELDVSIETVKVVLKALFLKLGVADRTHAVTVAMRRGFIEL